MRQHLLRGIFALVIIAACSSVLTLGFNDFAQYWVASRQVLTGHNPYSLHETIRAETALGNGGPGVILNPPWIIPLLVPLGFLSYAAAQKIWFAINFAALLLSAELSGRVYAPRMSPLRGWLLIFTFLPAMTCVAVGQMTALALLSIAGFAYFAAQKRWVAAGACLFLATLKPQLAYLLWPALFFWTVADVRRRWKLTGTTVLLIVAGSLAAFLLDPAVFSQYGRLWFHEKNMQEVFPTLAGALRVIFGAQRRWLQVVPAVGALGWLVWYGRRIKQWNWTQTTPLLVAVSLATAPYGWYFDEIVLWPGILRVLVQRRWTAIAAYIALNIANAAMIFTHRTTFWYSWTAPAWLIFYVFAVKESAGAVRENTSSQNQA